MAKFNRVGCTRIGSVLATVDSVPFLDKTLIFKAIFSPRQNDHLAVPGLFLPLQPLGPKAPLHVVVTSMKEVLPLCQAMRRSGADLSAPSLEL